MEADEVIWKKRYIKQITMVIGEWVKDFGN